MALYDMVERVKKREKISAQNEQEIKLQIVLPILRYLEWDDSDGTKVNAEYTVSNRRKERADFALYDKNFALDDPKRKPVALMEIKNEKFNFYDAVEQTFSYALKSSINFCILTNGYKWWFYLTHAHVEGGRDEDDKCFEEIDIEKEEIEGIVGKFKNYLSYKSLTSGDAKRLADSALCDKEKRKKLRDQLPHLWKEILRAPMDGLVELVEREVRKRDLDANEANEEVITEFLKREAENLGDSYNLQRTHVSSPTPPKAVKVNKNAAVTGRKILAYRLFGKRKSVDRSTDMWKDIALEIYNREKRDFDLVRQPRRPKSYVDVEKGRMKRPHLIPKSEYFIELHGSAQALEKRCRNLLAIFGYSEEDLVIERK